MLYITIHGQERWLSRKACVEEHSNFKNLRHRSGLFYITRIRWVKVIHKINRGSHAARDHVLDTVFLGCYSFVNFISVNLSVSEIFIFVVCF